MRRALLIAGLLAAVGSDVQAQDTAKVELKILYGNPKLRPALVVLPAPGLDSVRAIVERDLDFSDRFEMIPLPGPMEAPGPNGVNWAPYRAMNVMLAVDLQLRTRAGHVVAGDCGASDARAL